MYQFFLWMIHAFGNIRTVWRVKTWYSSKCLNTCKSKNIPGEGGVCPNTPILHTTVMPNEDTKILVFSQHQKSDMTLYITYLKSWIFD